MEAPTPESTPENVDSDVTAKAEAFLADIDSALDRQERTAKIIELIESLNDGKQYQLVNEISRLLTIEKTQAEYEERLAELAA